MPITNGNSETTELKSYNYYNDFMLFATDLLKYHNIMTFDFAEFHEQVARRMISDRYTLIILPRGHLKTTLLNCYATWRLFRQRDYEICMTSSTLDQSIGNLVWIQRMIESTPWLKHLMPDDKNTTWNKSQMLTSNNNQCYVRPFSPSARGKHPDEILYDDILRETDVSPEDIKDIFWSVFFPMGQTKNCKHIIVGTPMSSDDLFSEIEGKIQDGNSLWSVLKMKAVVETAEGQEKPLWGTRYSLDELNKIQKDMGNYRFNREMLCDPAAVGSGFFPKEMIMNATDESLTFNYTTKGTVVIGADFAMSDSPSGDYNCFTVIDSYMGKYPRDVEFNGVKSKVEVENPVIIKHIERYKGPSGQVEKLKELYKTYGASKIVVDISAFGTRFAQELRDLGINVEAQDFRPANRAQLLVNLRKLFESDASSNNIPRLIIPASQSDFTYDRTKHLIKELSGFKETRTKGGSVTIASNLSHDDTVFSLAMAVKDVVLHRPTPKQMVWSISEGRSKYGQPDILASYGRSIM